ncbi:hypothetical protein GIB67_038237 [Kingdonia uniflora]|uniref:Uncharacterized protein n=1 Tax=Kingdonia uniflora TaxID=39325 RepID=A0A7J7NHL8_9MAGN|nr:hypothetical protein GIB67_038237 [Kingdonia uniflora]
MIFFKLLEHAFEEAHTFQPSILNTDQENEIYGSRHQGRCTSSLFVLQISSIS